VAARALHWVSPRRVEGESRTPKEIIMSVGPRWILPGSTSFAFVTSLAACAVGSDEPSTNSADADLNTASTVFITNYTLALESDFASEADFLCSGRGVAMQGTGMRRDGRFVKYVSGGGGWCNSFARLCNCGSATFADTDRVFGASGRTLVKNYSIAVDKGVIPLGSSVWLDAFHHWFRADDTGGAIVGAHIDVYTEGDNPGFSMRSGLVVSSEPHEPDDPGPRGEAAENAPRSGAPEVTIAPRPTGGSFEALDVRHPIGAGGFITQCNESADGERVWLTTATGKDDGSRWAEAKYPQQALLACGEPRDGRHPLVFRSEAEGTLETAWVTQCADDPHTAHVYRVEGALEGHPMAAFQHDEIDESCP
jgi:hypothetical protein